MSKNGSKNSEMVHVVTSVKCRRRYAAHEKHAVVMKTNESGQSVSVLAREHAVTPSQLYQWRKQMEDGARVGVAADEGVVSKAEHKKLQERTRRLERLLGMKTEEVECLKEAVWSGREKKLSRGHPCKGSKISNERHCALSGRFEIKPVRAAKCDEMREAKQRVQRLWR